MKQSRVSAATMAQYQTTEASTALAGPSMKNVRHRIKGLIVLLLAALLWPNLAAAQTYTVAPPPFQTVLDNSGNIVNAGCVWTYLAGTTTAATTYTTSSGTANANPIIADSAGRFVAYLTPGTSYKFTYENVPCSASSHGSVLKTQDNIAAVPVSGLNVDITGTVGATVTAGDLLYLSDGSGALNAGQWYAADADNTYSSTTAVTVGFATAAITSGTSGSMRTTGRVTGLSGLTAGEIYYASATAAGLTATPPTNARCIGKADSTTSIVIPCDAAVLRTADSDGTHSLVVNTTSNLTADRLLSVVTGDAAQTLTLNRPQAPGGRCSLTTGTAVTTADVTAATTLYYTPYAQAANPNQISLYDGSAAWHTLTLSELSITMVGLTASKPYDVFVDYTAGTPALEVVVWTNDSTRATALATQNSVYVQTGDTDSLYVCTIYTDAAGGAVTDSYTLRHVWNYYNRVPSEMRNATETANSWNYTLVAYQQANANAANQLDLVVGVAEVSVEAMVLASAFNGSANIEVAVGIGYDSTTAAATGLQNNLAQVPVGSMATVQARLRHYPAVGRHVYTWLEHSQASGTTTWIGDNGGTFMQTGISGTSQR